MYFQKTRLWFWAATIVALVLLIGALAHAQLPSNPDETSVSIAINKIVDTTGWGGSFAVPYKLNDNVSGYFATAAQGGDLIRGRYHAEVSYAFGALDVTLYTDGTYKGPDVANLGRQADLGVTIGTNRPGGDVEIGIFGRNGGAFAKPNAFDDLSAKGYDEAVLETIDGLTTLNPAPTGLSFGDRNSVNLLVSLQKNVGDIGASLKLMPELVGSTDDAVDQAILNLHTDYRLSEKVSLGVGVDIGCQRFRGSGDIEQEVAGLLTLNLAF
ncbi:hypothetical protein C6499_22765 [Candidatus Poribacteria bacterium]|nr:MAG: hypothetical protein C6499_22765 [Candidatus Poribacteria bacterium]